MRALHAIDMCTRRKRANERSIKAKSLRFEMQAATFMACKKFLVQSLFKLWERGCAIVRFDRRRNIASIFASIFRLLLIFQSILIIWIQSIFKFWNQLLGIIWIVVYVLRKSTMILTNFLFFVVVVVAPMASSGWKNWLNLPKIQHLSRNVAVCRVVHTVTRCRRHNGSIEALPLLARFGETIERANGFVAACSLFANRPCIRNYWSKGVVKPHPPTKISVLKISCATRLFLFSWGWIDKFFYYHVTGSIDQPKKKRK